MSGQYATLIFDLDGTLSDPSEGIEASFAYALDTLGYPAVAASRIRAAIGPPLDVTFRELTGTADPGHIDELVASYREMYALRGYAQNRLYEQVPEQLSALHAAGVRMGVCTSKRVDFAIQILRMFGLLDYFDFVDGGDTGISKSMQLQSLMTAGKVDEHAVMVGDRAIDIESATDNGLRGVGVLWGFGDLQELRAVRPLQILERVSDLHTLLPVLSLPQRGAAGA